MAVNPNNLSYITLADLFEVNGKKVYAAFANGVQVYPEPEDDIFEHDGFRFMALQKSYLIYNESYNDDFSGPFYNPQWACTPSIGVRVSTGQDVFVCPESSLSPFSHVNPDSYANVSLLVSQYNGVLYLIMLDKSAASKQVGTDFAVIGNGAHKDIAEISSRSNTVHSYSEGPYGIVPNANVPESERQITTTRPDILAYIQWLLTQNVPQIGEV